MRPEDRIRIGHMVDAAKSVARFVEGRHRSDLDDDEMLRFALVHAYIDVDRNVLWKTVTEAVPALLQQLESGDPESE